MNDYPVGYYHYVVPGVQEPPSCPICEAGHAASVHVTQEAAAVYMHQIFGNITDIRVSKDAARWAANFTAPISSWNLSNCNFTIDVYTIPEPKPAVDLHTRVLDL